MSHYATGLVTEHRPYRGSKLMVALQLAEFANTQGEVNETIETMAERATLSARQFRRILRQMEVDGWIECVERSAGGWGVGSVYRINSSWLRVPVGWQPGSKGPAKQPGQNPDILTGLLDKEPGQNPDILTGLLGKEPGHPDRVVAPTPLSLKTLTPLPPKPETESGIESEPDHTKIRELGIWMLGLIREVYPNGQEPTWSGWDREIRLMAKAHTLREIASLFKFANADRTPRPGGDFCWANQIHSPKKLRKHWDALMIKRNAMKPTAAKPESLLCETCRQRPFTMQMGRGPKQCRECFAAAELSPRSVAA